MTNNQDQIIQISKDLGKIKGMEKSPYVLLKTVYGLVKVVNRESLYMTNDYLTFNDKDGIQAVENIYGPWLNNSSFDGEWSSAKIREGLRISISYYSPVGDWRVEKELEDSFYYIKCLNIIDPTADDLAMILGIIEYHKQFAKEVEDYLRGLK